MDKIIPEPIRAQCERKGGMKGIKARLLPDKEIKRRSRQCQALSDYQRLKILLILVEQPLCVCLIKEFVRVADSKLSYHLAVLKKAGLIRSNKQGSWIIYESTQKGCTISRIFKNV